MLLVIIGCKRANTDPESKDNTSGVLYDVPQVTASISGIVLDENNSPE
jgi:hypothetical protein